MSIEAMKHYEAALLEAFPRGATGDVFEHWNNARKAIAEAEKQEPDDLTIAYMSGFHDGKKREWVGLTDEERNELWESTDTQDDWELLMRVEAKLKEKNNG